MEELKLPRDLAPNDALVVRDIISDAVVEMPSESIFDFVKLLRVERGGTSFSVRAIPCTFEEEWFDWVSVSVSGEQFACRVLAMMVHGKRTAAKVPRNEGAYPSVQILVHRHVPHLGRRFDEGGVDLPRVRPDVTAGQRFMWVHTDSVSAPLWVTKCSTGGRVGVICFWVLDR